MGDRSLMHELRSRFTPCGQFQDDSICVEEGTCVCDYCRTSRDRVCTLVTSVCQFPPTSQFSFLHLEQTDTTTKKSRLMKQALIVVLLAWTTAVKGRVRVDDLRRPWSSVGLTEEELEPLLRELLQHEPYVPPVKEDHELSVDRPDLDGCNENVAVMEDKFNTLVPEEVKEAPNWPELQLVTMNIFNKLKHCEKQKTGGYLNLRTAILGGLFSGKVPLLDIPQDQQSRCLKAMVNEQTQCREFKTDVCNYVNPVNGEAPEFGAAFPRKMMLKYNNVFDASAVCQAMQEFVDNPSDLEAAIPVEHSSASVIATGISSEFLRKIDEGVAGGGIFGYRRRRRRY